VKNNFRSIVLGAIGAAVGLSFAVPAVSSASTVHDPTAGVVLNIGDISQQQALPLITSGLITSTGTTNGAGNTIYNVQGYAFQVTFNQFLAGPEVLAGVLGGSIDLGLTADTPVIYAQQQHVPLKVVATALPNKPGADFAIVLPKGSSVTSVAKLSGKTISAQSATINQYFLLAALKKAKVKPSSVTIDNLTPLNALSALNGGSLDAAVLPQPYVDLATAIYKDTVLTTAVGYVSGYSFLDASNAALANTAKSTAIGDYLKLLSAASKWTKANQAQWITVIASTYHLPAFLATALVTNTQGSYVPISAKVIAATQAEANLLYAGGFLPSSLKVNSLFDTRYNSIVAKLN